MSRRKDAAIIVLALVIPVALVYWPLLIGQVAFHGDTVLWLLPARWFVRDSLLSGQSPLWNPYQSLGFPLLADPQYGLFYPPNWLLLIVPDAMVAHLCSWLGFGHLIWGGLGMALLTRRLGACPVGAAVAGLAWTLSGHTTSAWLVGPLVLAHAWIPWVARGFAGLADPAGAPGKPRLVGALWPSVMSLLTGEVFISGMAAIFACVVMIACTEELRPTRASLRTIARPVAIWLTAMLIAALTWLPPTLLLHTTARAQAFDAATAGLFSFHPLRLLEMVASNGLGDPIRQYPAGSLIGEEQSGGLPLFYSSYLGVVTVALGLFGIRRRRMPLVLAGMAFLALLVALGRHLPVHQIWRTILFPFSHMRSPEKYIVLMVAALSPLAGLGASRLLDPDDPPRLRRLFVLGAVLVGLVGLAPLVLPHPLASCVRAAGARSLVALVLLLGILRARRLSSPLASQFVGVALLGLVALDLGMPANHLAGFGETELLTIAPPAARTILNDHGKNPVPPRFFREPGVEMVIQLGDTPTWRDSQVRAVRSLSPNTVNILRLAVVPGYEAAFPDLMSELGAGSYPAVGIAARLFSIRYALLNGAGVAPLRMTANATVLSEPLPTVKLVRVDEALPRAYVPGQVWRLAPAEVTRHLADEAVVMGRQVLIEDAHSSLLTGDASGPAACTIESFTNTRVVAYCTASSPTVAVFVEQFDPSWSATVDGRPAPVERANLFVRAVPLPTGTHRVELRYRAPGLHLAGLLSGISLLGLVVGVVWRRRSSVQPSRRKCP